MENIVGKKLKDLPLLHKYSTCYYDKEGKKIFSEQGYYLRDYTNRYITRETSDFFEVSGFTHGWFRKSDVFGIDLKLNNNPIYEIY